MTDRVNPPFDGTLRQYRAWCRKHGGTLKIAHRNPRGVISISQGGFNHVYKFDKYGKGDGKYSWSSSFVEDFMARATAAAMKEFPDS